MYCVRTEECKWSGSMCRKVARCCMLWYLSMAAVWLVMLFSLTRDGMEARLERNVRLGNNNARDVKASNEASNSGRQHSMISWQ